MKRTLRKRHSRAGQSLVEFAVAIPILLVIIINVVNFGALFFDWISVANAARTGVQYAAISGVAVTGGEPPSASDVQALVAGDIGSLPNSATAQICVSSNATGVVSCNRGSAPAGAPPAADAPEGAGLVVYRIVAVDVTYTYSPVVPMWDIPALGLHTTIPPTTIHRQAKMRLLQ